MNKILITDLKNYKQIDLTKYDKVKILLYGDFKDYIEELDKSYPNIEFISSEYYYNSIYQVMGEFIKKEAKDDLLLIGHYKMLSLKLFDLFFVKVIIDSIKDSEIYMQTIFDYDINQLYVNGNKIIFLSKVNKNYKRLLKNILSMASGIVKSLFAISVGNIINKKKQYDVLFFDYEEKNIIKHHLPYFSNYVFESLYFNYPIKKLRLDIKYFKQFLLYSLKLLKSNIKYSFSFDYLYISVNNILKYAITLSKYDIKALVGVMDSNMGYEFLYLLSKNENIKLLSLSHANHLYRFRIHYLSNPFDYYFVSVTYLQQIILDCQYIDTNCKFISIGYSNYGDKEFVESYQKEINKKYDIVFICDYYHNTFAIHPFSKENTRNMAKVLLELSSKYKILVRPRRKDEYYEDLYKILKDNVDYSLGEERPSIYEDIKSAKLGLGAFSNGIKDGMLMRVPFIQLNYINLITTFDDIAKDNGLYIARNEEETLKLIDDFFANRLKPLDFEKVNKKYLDNGRYDKNIVLNILKNIIKST